MRFQFLPRPARAVAGIPSFLQKSRDDLISVLFPTACPLCRQEVLWTEGAGICRSCWQAIKSWEGPVCARCGVPIASGEVPADPLCTLCRNNTYHFDLARSYGIYSYPLRNLILYLKFHHRPRWGRRLGELLASLWPAIETAEIELVVPVPLHPSRERERGYNQAEVLALGLRRGLRRMGLGTIPRVEARVLVRKRPTLSQSGLHQGARQENVRGAFAVRLPDAIRGRSVLLVDDVMTTGATVSACALALKRAGARKVLTLTLARATPQFPDSQHQLLVT